MRAFSSNSPGWLGKRCTSASTIAIDLDGLNALAGNIDTLIEQINHDLLYGQLSATSHTAIASAVNQVPASNALGRTQTALQLVLASPEFAIQK